MSKKIKWLAVITILVDIVSLILNVSGNSNSGLQVLSNILTVVLAGLLLSNRSR